MPRRFWTTYWRADTWGDNEDNSTLDHVASNDFSDVQVGDVVYVVRIEQGQLLLGGRLSVAEIMGQKQAEQRTGKELWEAEFHLFADETSLSPFRTHRPLPMKIVNELRFGKDRKKLSFASNDELDSQTLRGNKGGTRELAPESARLIDRFLLRVGDLQPTTDSRRRFFTVYWEPDQLDDQGQIAGITSDELVDLEARSGDVIYPVRINQNTIEVRGLFTVNNDKDQKVLWGQSESLIIDPFLLDALAFVGEKAGVEGQLEISELRKRFGGISELTSASGKLLGTFYGQTSSSSASRRLDYISNPITAAISKEDEPPESSPDWMSLIDDVLSRGLIIEPPPKASSLDTRPPSVRRSFRPRRIDFEKAQHISRELGDSGEDFIVEIEREELRKAGRSDLALKVIRVSQVYGDGLGYDVLSFALDGREKHIEVKTTAGGKREPFTLTANELAYSSQNPASYFLYRVFDFWGKRRVFVLHGNISEQLSLTPTEFRVHF